jgi:ABC-type thiamine transport system ATPase subunit
MSARSSLFAKIRATAIALGRSERTASRKSRLLSSASFADFIRLTPEQNVKLGLSPKARHYALKGVRITKATPTISARQFETKRANELFGLTPEKATQARQHGAVSYVSADQRANSDAIRPGIPI